MVDVNVQEMAGAASQTMKSVMSVEPMMAGIAGMFVPQVALVQPWVLMIVPYLEKALDNIAASNNGDALAAIIDLIQHLTAGQADAPALANDAAPSSPPVVIPSSNDPSAGA